MQYSVCFCSGFRLASYTIKCNSDFIIRPLWTSEFYFSHTKCGNVSFWMTNFLVYVSAHVTVFILSSNHPEWPRTSMNQNDSAVNVVLPSRDHLKSVYNLKLCNLILQVNDSSDEFAKTIKVFLHAMLPKLQGLLYVLRSYMWINLKTENLI